MMSNHEQTVSHLSNYVDALQRELATGRAGEHAYRPALKALLESVEEGVIAVNDPDRIDVGAPDFIVLRGESPIGFVEAKDVGENLGRVERGEQMGRYLGALGNLILTDYLEFRWYVEGEPIEAARLGEVRGGKIRKDREGMAAVAALLHQFTLQCVPTINTPRDLAERMAAVTGEVRRLIVNTYQAEGDDGALHRQHAAFEKTLIPGLTTAQFADMYAQTMAQFADMYAQTMAYGLFAARVRGNGDFNRQSAAWNLPPTNPFLQKLFNEIAGPGLDGRVAWLADSLADLLARADMAAVLKDFGSATRREDPVVHFYETFLAAYDPAMRERRGVYYTPEPVVSYIVRSVDWLLREQFGRHGGLADPNTLILDPAVGTGTFLYLVINHIHQAMAAQGQLGAWDGYVRDHLLPRLFGFELLMAPYAMAHMKLGIQLQETGYQFESDQRLGIYLTNALKPIIEVEGQRGFGWFITEEGQEAERVKRDEPIMVVLGNPPYSGHSANKGAWIDERVRDYYFVDGEPLGERNPKNLQDDYVKFIRFGQWRIGQTGEGILAFVTNHGYLDNPTFRGMRQQLMDAFSEIYVLDLHGSARKRETTPDGGPDENVFDIQQGVAIGLFVKRRGADGPARVFHADLWGKREGKYAALWESDVTTTEWEELMPSSPFYLFIPQDIALLPEYEVGWKVTDIYPVTSTGVKTHHDRFVIDFNREALERRIAEFRDLSFSDEVIRGRYRFKDTHGWKLSKQRRLLNAITGWHEYFTQCLYRPFDVREIFYHESIVERPRAEVMRHMLGGENIGICTTRQVEIGRGFEHVFCTANLIQHHTVSIKEVNYLFPLYLYPDRDRLLDASDWPPGPDGRVPNLSPAFVAAMEARLGMRFEPHPHEPSVRTPSPCMGRGQGVGLGWAGVQPHGQLWGRLKPLARQMRTEPTEAEDALWQRLRRKQVGGVKFRRQHAIGRFIVDFYCAEVRLVVEVDGPIHEYTPEEDAIRQEYLESLGTRVMRFTNEEVENAPDEAVAQIAAAIEEPPEAATFGPEDVFYYIYAVLHSPTYRERYAEFLRIDFPRIPLTGDPALFWSLVEKGAELVGLHLLESSTVHELATTFPVKGSDTVEKGYPKYTEPTDKTQGRVHINKTQYFEGVAPEVWGFHVGGYQVLHKWLKDRRGRALSWDDIQHYQRVVVALGETMRVMDEIDDLISEWPISRALTSI